MSYSQQKQTISYYREMPAERQKEKLFDSCRLLFA